MAKKVIKTKKTNKNKTSIQTFACKAVVVIIATFFALLFSQGNPDLSEPDVSESETTTEVSTTEVSTTEEPTSETETTTVESTTAESTTSEPVSSFYDDVKYRSPDAVPADIFKHGRNLMLLNRNYELPVDFQWNLVYWSNGNYVDAMYLNCEEYNSVKAVDKAAYQPLKDMFNAANKAGVPLELVSAYRSIYLQDKLFTRSVNSYISQGYSEAEAIKKANYSRTFSGTSEHNTGLGFDLLQKGNYNLSTSFENTAEFKWLMKNAENYGFILRYPKNKTNETGIMYEPWHFRYVGVEHAKKINELGMCLEEYIDYLEA